MIKPAALLLPIALAGAAIAEPINWPLDANGPADIAVAKRFTGSAFCEKWKPSTEKTSEPAVLRVKCGQREFFVTVREKGDGKRIMNIRP